MGRDRAAEREQAHKEHVSREIAKEIDKTNKDVDRGGGDNQGDWGGYEGGGCNDSFEGFAMD